MGETEKQPEQPKAVQQKMVIDGISGRQLEKLALTWQTAAYVSDDGVLTEKMAMDKCLEAIKQNKQKVHWESEQEKQESKSIYATEDDGFEDSGGRVMSRK